MPIDLCPHRMNPVSCPTCFRNKPAKPKEPQKLPGVRDGVPMAPVMSVGEATMRATQRQAAVQAPPQASNGRVFKEPFSSANHNPPPAAFNPDQVWQPPKRPDLIDQQPRHPHIDKSIAR